MSNAISFVKTAILGGVTVILPAAILFFVFQWLFRLVTNVVQPITSTIVARSQLSEFIADLVAIAIILLFCFVLGVAVKTRLGAWLFHVVENSILRVAPGYTMIKDIVMQFSGGKNTPFTQVALVRPFGSGALVTAFVTDEHGDGSYTVFMPTGPNPTSGWIFHLPGQDVQLVDTSVETTMRTVIGCGVGSKPLLDEFREKQAKLA